jgi:pimeloyl-ACP methyl ester carboxylesterase
MQTQRVPVAPGVDLAVDTWPSAVPAAQSGPQPAPFVLVHGLASNARMWDGVACALTERGHPAITVDLRGHGRSSKPDGPYDMATVADDVTVVIRELGLDRPVVAGQSWGGNVVLELALREPSLVRGVVCVDGGWLEPCASFPSWEACRETLAPPRLAGLHRDEIEGYIRSAHADWPETGIEGALANFEVRDDGTVAPWLTFDHHIAVLRGLWDHRPSEIYARVTVPVLLIPADTGEHARASDKRQGVALAMGSLRHVRERWFTGDHDIHAQHPVEVADVMLEQLADGFFA